MVFSTPLKSDAKEIKIMYGKQILPNVTVNLNFSLRVSNPETNNCKNEGKIAMIIIENGTKINNNILKIFESTIFASSFPSLFKIPENRGKKEALNAPSAKILRKVLDILIATRIASE
jgi:hypothetical protein